MAVALFGLSPLAARAQVYFVGTPPVTLGSGFLQPGGVAVDAAGDVFVADTFNNAVKEIGFGGSAGGGRDVDGAHGHMS